MMSRLPPSEEKDREHAMAVSAASYHAMASHFVHDAGRDD